MTRLYHVPVDASSLRSDRAKAATHVRHAQRHAAFSKHRDFDCSDDDDDQENGLFYNSNNMKTKIVVPLMPVLLNFILNALWTLLAIAKIVMEFSDFFFLDFKSLLIVVCAPVCLVSNQAIDYILNFFLFFWISGGCTYQLFFIFQLLLFPPPLFLSSGGFIPCSDFENDSIVM
jgi:hypothetical protein